MLVGIWLLVRSGSRAGNCRTEPATLDRGKCVEESILHAAVINYTTLFTDYTTLIVATNYLHSPLDGV